MHLCQSLRLVEVGLSTEQKKQSEVRIDLGIVFCGAQVSWAGCIAKFWMHDHGWEYAIEAGHAEYVRALAARSPGAAFNWCKKHASQTFGPYNLKWELIDEDKMA